MTLGLTTDHEEDLSFRDTSLMSMALLVILESCPFTPFDSFLEYMLKTGSKFDLQTLNCEKDDYIRPCHTISLTLSPQ